MQIEAAIKHVLFYRKHGCCFGGFYKHGHDTDENLTQMLRLADGQPGHELCGKILRFIKTRTPGHRQALRENILR